MTLGAIPLAIETINNDPNLLPGRQLQFVAADIGNPGMCQSQFSISWVLAICHPLSTLGRHMVFWQMWWNQRPNIISKISSTYVVGNDGLTALAIRRMTEMRDNNSTIAFIGPDGQCAAEALVAAAWNLPMITHVMIKNTSSLFTLLIQFFFLLLFRLFASILVAWPRWIPSCAHHKQTARSLSRSGQPRSVAQCGTYRLFTYGMLIRRAFISYPLVLIFISCCGSFRPYTLFVRVWPLEMTVIRCKSRDSIRGSCGQARLSPCFTLVFVFPLSHFSSSIFVVYFLIFSKKTQGVVLIEMVGQNKI